MGRVEVKVDGVEVAAANMLGIATTTLRLLKAIEQEICKRNKTKPSIRWRVDMMSGFSYGLIAIHGQAKTSDDETLKVDEMVWAEAVKRLGSKESASGVIT